MLQTVIISTVTVVSWLIVLIAAISIMWKLAQRKARKEQQN